MKIYLEIKVDNKPMLVVQSPAGFFQWLKDYAIIKMKGQAFFLPYVGEVKSWKIKKIIWHE